MLKQGIVALFALCCASFLSGVQAADLRIETEGGGERRQIIHASPRHTGSGSLRERSARLRHYRLRCRGLYRSNARPHVGNVTIAGETAPSGGVMGGGLTIRASDVLIEHIAIYPDRTQNRRKRATRSPFTARKSCCNILRISCCATFLMTSASKVSWMA